MASEPTLWGLMTSLSLVVTYLGKRMLQQLDICVTEREELRLDVLRLAMAITEATGQSFDNELFSIKQSHERRVLLKRR